ncbi:MAG: hypothetical protein NUW02_01885 [Candidatus Campbellbacteria bacterium]|nr:hypothetical protein [Candidatus Campbellbacteria bacterium]
MANDLRGSQWHKWDIHVHTPKSFVQEYGTDTEEIWEKYITDLEALPPEIKVIGINDYLFLEGYEKVLAYKNQGRLSNIVLILPVIEFRLKEFVGHEKLRRLNYHIIFSDEQTLSVEVIKTQFLSGLRGMAHLDPDLTDITWGGVVNAQTLEGLGKAVRESTPEDKKSQLVGNDLELGFNNINFELSGIEKILGEKGDTNTYLQGKYLKAIGKSEWEDFRWDAGVAEKKTIINSAHFVFCASATAEQAISSKQKLKEQGVNDRLLHCSDAHRFSDDPSAEQERRIGTCFSWIKADLTFEGLMQTLYEPGRLQIQERNPGDSKPSRVLIDRITYKNSTNEERTVLFNKDLNSIIGIRGSGKSTLLRNMTKSIDPVQFKETEKGKKEPYPLQDFKVIWVDGQENSGNEESHKSAFYIPQGYLSALAYDDGDLSRERDSFLTKLLKNNSHFARAVNTFDTFVAENDLKIQSGIQDLLTANSDHREAQDKLKSTGSLKEVQDDIDKRNTELQKYKGVDLSDKELSAYSLAQKELDQRTKQLEVLSQDRQILTSLRESSVSILVSDKELNALSPTRRDAIQKALREKGRTVLIDLIDVELKEIETQTDTLTKTLAVSNATVEKLREKVEKNKAVTDLTKEVLEFEKTKVTIAQLIDQRNKAEVTLDAAKDTLVVAYSDFKTKQGVIYSSIKFEGEFKFLNIQIATKYDIQQTKDFVEHFINTRDSEARAQSEVSDLFGENPTEPSEATVRKILALLLSGQLKPKVGGGDLGTILGQYLKNRYVIDYPNSVKTSEDEVYFKDMTGGQKAITFLELIFSLSNERYPILIDQPEDDLDVGGVANDLVNFITGEKVGRQIIVVSHNASLVVCSDSEQIINSTAHKISSNKFDFSYVTGSIENPDRREDVINVLEGGHDALNKRRLKLRIK